MPNNEYIDKVAACNEIKRFTGYLDDDMIYRLQIALNRIPAADVEPKQRWIPVTERLPEYPGRFMCVYEDEEYGEVGHCIDWGRYDPDDGWYVSGVTHWMPLPEPPKMNKEEDK